MCMEEGSSLVKVGFSVEFLNEYELGAWIIWTFL
jgi:hypothetical protein